jgi:hypothetical protein
VARILATLWSDAEFTGRLDIKLSCDWQIFSLLIRANTGSGPKTEHPIDFASIVTFILQSLLHLLDIAPMCFPRHFAAEIGSGIERSRVRSRAWSRDPRRHQ